MSISSSVSAFFRLTPKALLTIEIVSEILRRHDENMIQTQKRGWILMALLSIFAVVLIIPNFFGLRTIEDQLTWAIDADLKALEESKYLHSGFSDLNEIQVFASSESLKKLFLPSQKKIKTHKGGKYDLEVFLDLINEGGVMIQYDLVDRQSGNTVWELGRTFQHKIQLPAAPATISSPKP